MSRNEYTSGNWKNELAKRYADQFRHDREKFGDVIRATEYKNMTKAYLAELRELCKKNNNFSGSPSMSLVLSTYHHPQTICKKVSDNSVSYISQSPSKLTVDTLLEWRNHLKEIQKNKNLSD